MFEGPHVVVAGGNPATIRLASVSVRTAALRIDVARSHEELRRLIHDRRPDLVLVAEGFPDIRPRDLVAWIRTHSGVPILVLGGSAAPTDAVVGLDAGADDYLPIPFHPDELLARVRAVLRWTRPSRRPGAIRLGALELDLDRRVLMSSGALVRLSRREWLLLEVLARNVGAPVGRDELLAAGWGQDAAARQVLRVSIGRLRRKLGTPAGADGPLRTIPGGRYVLDPAWRPS